MGKYVPFGELNNRISDAFYKNASVVGTMQGLQETKGGGWTVLLLEKKLYACATFSSIGYSCAEEIDASELHMYVDNVESAKEKLSDLGGHNE